MSLVNEEAENRDSFEDALETVSSQFFSMVPLGGGFFKAALENYGNKDTFRDQAIEPVYMNNRSRYMRYDDDTTAIAKETSRLMNKYLAWTGLPMYSPLKTDHILDQTTGGLYKRVHEAIEEGTQYDLGGLVGVAKQAAGGRAFFVPDRMTSRSVSDFYQEMARLRTRKDDLSVERLEKDAEELSGVNTRLKELNDYRALMSVIRNLNESDQEKYKPYIAGLAREAMGFREHHRSKSPTREPAGVLPKEVEVAVQDFYKDRAYSAVRLSQIPQTVPERQLEDGITLADLRRARYDEIEARLDFIDQNLESSPLLVDFLAKEFENFKFKDLISPKLKEAINFENFDFGIAKFDLPNPLEGITEKIKNLDLTSLNFPKIGDFFGIDMNLGDKLKGALLQLFGGVGTGPLASLGTDDEDPFVESSQPSTATTLREGGDEMRRGRGAILNTGPPVSVIDASSRISNTQTAGIHIQTSGDDRHDPYNRPATFAGLGYAGIRG